MMSDISLSPFLTAIYLEYYQVQVNNYYEIVFTILFSSYRALYCSHTTMKLLRVSFWELFPVIFFFFSFFHLFPSYFLIGLVGLLLNYSSFSHDMTEDLSGNCFHGFTCSLLSFFFHIQFKDQLVIFKTFFPVLLRCRQPYPKSIIAVH